MITMMTEDQFVTTVQDMVKAKRVGAPLDVTVGELTLRLNADCGLYGLTAYGPEGAYDRMRDIRPERVEIVARKIYLSMVGQILRVLSHRAGFDCGRPSCGDCTPSRI
jgi:hypothetical protein